MRTISLLPALILFSVPSTANSDSLPLTEVGNCVGASGIQCELKCARPLGEQCLITQVNFAGDVNPVTDFVWRAKFLTCINANVDIQLTSLTIEKEENLQQSTPVVVAAIARSNSHQVRLKSSGKSIIEAGQTYARHARIPFESMLNSGDQPIEVSLGVEGCNSSNGEPVCKISGKLIATTDPNIRCDFHDKQASGAYRPATLTTSRSIGNAGSAIGQIGPAE